MFTCPSVRFRRLADSAACLLVLFGAASCASRQPRPPKTETISLEIRPAGQAANMTIHVYVAPANQLTDKRYIEGSVDDFLKQQAGRRSSDVDSFLLTQAPHTISKTNTLWRTSWLTADHLIVTADLPQNFGGQNNRRVEVPLYRGVWRHLGKQPVLIEIHESGVRLVSAPGNPN